MKKKLLLIWFFVLLLLSINFIYASAEAPKNYLRGKFYTTVKDNFLVATDKMMDPLFEKTVIVMIQNDEAGAWGLVINKPIGLIPLSSLVNLSENIEDKTEQLNKIDLPVFWGGPVDVGKIFILHTKEYRSETTKYYKEISVSSDYKILFDIAEKKGPEKSLIIMGYSGWGSGQLEGEMEKGHWILSELDLDIIFKEKKIDQWIKALENSFIRL